MTRIIFVEHNGREHQVDAKAEQSVMQGAVENAVPGILADCGGACSCGTCHGYIDAAWMGKLAPAASDEEALLDCVLAREENSRLTCQIKVTDELEGLIVRLPASQI